LVNAPFPFNAILVPFIPFFALMENSSLNNFILKVEYLLSLLIVSGFYSVFSLLAVPFAYIKVLIIKLRLVNRRISLASRSKRVHALVFWIFLGLFILLLNWASEIMLFLKFAFKEK